MAPPIWDILEISPKEYPFGLWEWNKVHIHFRRRNYTIKSHGYFIRRYEFDNFLLRRSKVQTIEGHHVKEIERDIEGNWIIDHQYRAKYLIGAGGSHCPVARTLFANRDNVQCGTQEREFEGNPDEIAACRAGEDGEPEILLHDDMKGYSWNVPKGHWLNVGTGTKVAGEVLQSWSRARAFFEDSGTIPPSCFPMLDKMKGHGYTTFDPKHLAACQADNVFRVGDALGLAQPLTGEGILPSVLSGKLCAVSIVKGLPQTYGKRLRTHPVISGYQLQHAIQTRVRKIFKKKRSNHHHKPGIGDRLIVKVFTLLFSGKQIPGSGLLVKMRK